jgi:predicted nucleotidyltransferase/Arc/MetJ-type ribon-helix-helix transcriptional regulator
MGVEMATKVMVSFPKEFLAEVDRVAREEHRSRSELVREALRLYLGVRQQQEPPANSLVREAAVMQGHGARPAVGRGEDHPAAVRQIREALEGEYQTLADQDRRIVRELQQRLAEITPICNLRIFGSRARGNAAPDSDLDVFIELEEATPELRQRIRELAWAVGFEWDRVISTVVTTREDLEHGAMGANPLILNVEREGIRP